MGRLGDGGQRMARVAWLRAAFFAPAGAQSARAGLLQAVAARGLAAVAALLPQLLLEGLHPSLEGEEQDSQCLHEGQHGFFALPVSGMDIFWSRKTLGCHISYYARLFSALHEGMVNFLVCLSSNEFFSKIKFREGNTTAQQIFFINTFIFERVMFC